MASSLSLPLTVDGQTLGALNLYATVSAAFTGEPAERADAFAAQVGAALP